MSTEKTLNDLKLGDVVFQSDPWDNKVLRRHIIKKETVEEYDPLMERYGDPRFAFWVSGGFMGLGERLTKDLWNIRYFMRLEDARRACTEQSVKLKAEREEQIRKEIAELEKQL